MGANDEHITSLDYMSGGVPPLVDFQMTVQRISELSAANPDDSMIQALCFIGLFAYFESFCKDHFAALINICPSIAIEFAEKRGFKLSLTSVTVLLRELQRKLGFLIAEECDFGTAKSINSLYMDLLKVTPFSKAEARLFEKALHDRNLLVHHGGTFTSSYALTHLAKSNVLDDAHFYGLVITIERLKEIADFLYGIAKKASLSTCAALAESVEHAATILDANQTNALKALVWEID